MVLGKVAEPEPNRRMRVNLDCAVELLTLAVLLLAVEYKGEHLRNTKDTLEKDAIGRLWAAKSGGKCLYATVFKSEGGLDVKGQLDKIFLK